MGSEAEGVSGFASGRGCREEVHGGFLHAGSETRGSLCFGFLPTPAVRGRVCPSSHLESMRV